MRQYDYSKLLGRIKERGFTQAAFAKRLGISPCTLNLSLNNKRGFRQDEIFCAIGLLHIPTNELANYFFMPKLHITKY